MPKIADLQADTPSLDAVLAVGNDAGGQAITDAAGIYGLSTLSGDEAGAQFFAGVGGDGGALTIRGGLGLGAAPGGQISVQGGDNDTAQQPSAFISEGQQAARDGRVKIVTGGSFGAPGEVLTAVGDFTNTALWGAPAAATVPTAWGKLW